MTQDVTVCGVVSVMVHVVQLNSSSDSCPLGTTYVDRINGAKR